MTETPGHNESEARDKSTVVGIVTQAKVANSDPLYEALTQQITYLISAITNQNSSKDSEHNGSKSGNGNGKYLSSKF